MFENSRHTIDESTHHHLKSINALKEREFVNWIEANQQAIRRIASRPLVNDLVATMNQLDETSQDYQDNCR